MTAINSNRAIRGPVTAVPVVAGKGVRLVADTENNRWVVEADETVLWSGTFNTLSSTIPLSETITNFERVRLYVKWHPTIDSAYQCFEYLVSSNSDVWQGMCAAINGSSFYQSFFTLTVSNGNTVAYTAGRLRGNYSVAQTNEAQATLCKVVGINRISASA